MIEPMLQWIAVYTNSRAEKQVAQRLCNLAVEYYLPLQKKMRKWSDRMKLVETPLIPSYVFVHVSDSDLWRLRQIQGVVGIVSFGGKAAVIPDDQIAALRRLVESNMEIFVHNMEGVKKGARVRITEGPFRAMEGEIVKDLSRGNFGVRLDGLNFVFVVEMDKSIMEVVDDV